MQLAAPFKVFDVNRDHWRGAADAPVTLIEYGDYECPYSRAAYRSIEAIERDGAVTLRFVFRHLPLIEIHPHALAAAQAAEVAAADGRFWEMHDRLFHNQRSLEAEDLRRHALEAGVDAGRYDAGLAGGAGLDRIRADAEGALRAGARGTPTLVVNGLIHAGSYETDTLTAALTSAAH